MNESLKMKRNCVGNRIYRALAFNVQVHQVYVFSGQKGRKFVKTEEESRFKKTVNKKIEIFPLISLTPNDVPRFYPMLNNIVILLTIIEK